MTLQQALRQFNSEETLYIGSKSAFFFIGTMNQLNEEIRNLDKKWKKHFDDSLKSSKGSLEYALKNPPKPGSVIKKKIWENGRHFEKEFTYEEQLKIYEDRLRIYKAALKNAEIQQSAWKRFEDREVLHVYRNMKKDGLIIIVKGYESGPYWLFDEADRQRKGLSPYKGDNYEVQCDDNI